jgi:type II secretory pathway pseudopilin PulG
MGDRKGFALAATLMVLAVISLLGTVSLQSAAVETQLSARDRDARQALCVAQAGLEEARSCASRGWGKIKPAGSHGVTVVTPPPPGLSWSDGRYAGFTLIDEAGAAYPVAAHTDAPSPTIRLDGGTPVEGRFFLVRSGFPGTWSSGRLAVADDRWALASGVDTWAGWLLWNGAGEPRVVAGSDTHFPVGAPGEVRLRLASDPGPGPYTLSLHPWLAALASRKSSLPGDFDAPGTPDRWDRVFTAGGKTEGCASVTGTWSATGAYAGTYQLTAVATVGRISSRASLRVYRPGRPDQRVGDWVLR